MTTTVKAAVLSIAAILSAPGFACAQAPATPAAPSAPAAAAPAPPLFSTTKVEGTDGVFIFRYQGHQSMFIVTSDGVIATDPIGLRRPQAVKTYIEEIQKIAAKPVRYVIYSHAHYDHIAGGKPFKDLGAKFIAHKNAKAQLTRFPSPDVVMPDQVVGDKHVITLGNTKLELLYAGPNHSDNSLVMRLPKEKIIFAVDFLPIRALPFRNMPDTTDPKAWEASVKKVAAMEWDRLIPGHPGPGGRLGTKQDVNDLATYFGDLREAVQKAAASGQCTDTAMRDLKLPKYETWGNYATFLPMNIERMCYMNNGN